MCDIEIVEFNGKKYKRYLKLDVASRKNYFQRSNRGIANESATAYLHRDVWEYHNGKIPKEFHIHHKDGNPLNNNIENLECLSLRGHHQKHAQELGLSYSELYSYRASLGSYFHKTNEGREFKSAQAKNIWKTRLAYSMTCEFCKKIFTKHSTRGLKNKCCSQKCTNKLKFSTGEYAISYVCEICNKEFKYMKYKPRRYCCKACQTQAHVNFYNSLKENSTLPPKDE